MNAIWWFVAGAGAAGLVIFTGSVALYIWLNSKEWR